MTRDLTASTKDTSKVDDKVDVPMVFAVFSLAESTGYSPRSIVEFAVFTFILKLAVVDRLRESYIKTASFESAVF